MNAISSNDVSDDQAMLQMMDALDGTPFGDVLGDGAYDTTECRESIRDHRGKPVIPPDKSAVVQRRHLNPALKPRDQAIRRIADMGIEGRKLWKQGVGYHRRSRVETFMFRLKTLLGERLNPRKPAIQITESTIKMHVLNRMLELGRPDTYKLT